LGFTSFSVLRVALLAVEDATSIICGKSNSLLPIAFRSVSKASIRGGDIDFLDFLSLINGYRTGLTSRPFASLSYISGCMKLGKLRSSRLKLHSLGVTG
jgi:hypothetical protein